MKTLLKEWHHADDRNWKDSLSELFQFCQETVVPEKKGESWLIGVLSGILCCTLMGTVAYSLRTEFVRNESSRMATVLPFREVVKQIHSTASHSANETSLLDFLITQRADIVVLISIIVFVALASKLRDPERQSNLPTEIDDGHRATERL